MASAGVEDAVLIRKKVPTQMGTIRFGGSGRPVPIIASSGTADGDLSKAQDGGVKRHTHVQLEPHPHSPFGRKIDLTQKITFRPDSDTKADHFQVKKTIVSHSRLNRSQTSRSPQQSEVQKSGSNDLEAPHTQTNASFRKSISSAKPVHSSTVRREQPSSSSKSNQLRRKRQSSSSQRIPSFHDEEKKFDIPVPVPNSAHTAVYPPPQLPVNTTGQGFHTHSVVHGIKRSCVHSHSDVGDTGPDIGDLSSMFLSKTRTENQFYAAELDEFTHRLKKSPETKIKHYHISFRQSATLNDRVDTVNKFSEIRVSPHGFTSHTKPVEASTDIDWRQMEETIDHIYEDPSIDFVQLSLLQNYSTNGKKRKLLERKRVLVAASELRDHELEKRRQQDLQRQRKQQIQELSKTIRLRNRSAVKEKLSHGSDVTVQHKKRHHEDIHDTLVTPQRKPPVPRLSGQHLSKKNHWNRQMKNESSHTDHVGIGKDVSEASRSTEITTSILVGEPIMPPTATPTDHNKDGIDRMLKIQQLHTTSGTHSENILESRKRKLRAMPRSEVKHKPNKSVQDSTASKEREQRRALGREYMLLQKQSRQLVQAKMKEQQRIEQDHRRKQLELLEQARLESVRRAKKKKTSRRRKGSMIELDLLRANVDAALGSRSKGRNSPTSIDYYEEHEEEGIHLEDLLSNRENVQAFGNLASMSSPRSTSDYEDKASIDHYDKTFKSEGSHQDDPLQNNRLGRLLKLDKIAETLSARVNQLARRRKLIHLQTKNDTLVSTFTEETPESRVRHGLTIMDSQDEIRNESSDGGYSIRSRSEDDIEEDDSDNIDIDEEDSDNFGIAEEDSNYQGDIALELKTTERHTRLNDIGHDNGLHRDEMLGKVDVDMHPDFVFVTPAFGAGEELDIDVRTIGVYNIGVVWPLQPNHLSQEDPSNQRMALLETSSSSSSSWSSTHSSPKSQRNGESGTLSQPLDHADGNFETPINKHPDQHQLQATLSKTHKNEATTNHEGLYESDATVNDHQEYVEPNKILPAFLPSTPTSNNGLYRMLLEVDDSLSVVDRTARMLFEQQQQQMQRKREEEHQRMLAAEKHEQEEKDAYLASVMALLTDENLEKTKADEIQIASDDPESMLHYEGLEEIMTEVENKRAQARAYNDELLRESETSHTITPLESDKSLQPSAHFWDQVLTDASLLKRTDQDSRVGSGHRSRVIIDDSELVNQREQRVRLENEDENMIASEYEQKRVLSPRALARQLMAEVEYHEALHEAHLQLNMMEHAHTLEQTQQDTINMASAFKEEMENNLTAHQLAMEHAALAQKFDDDMREVTGELQRIEQTQEAEKAAELGAMNKALKTANLRECGAQTEPPQHYEVGTIAKLYVDTYTTTMPSTSDAAVQYDSLPLGSEITSATSAQAHHYEEETGKIETSDLQDPTDEYAYDDEDGYEEDNFEKESHLQVDLKPEQHSVSDIRSSISVEESRVSEDVSVENEIYDDISAADGENDHETKPNKVQDALTSAVAADSVASSNISAYNIDAHSLSAHSLISDEHEEVDDDMVSSHHAEEDGSISASVGYDDDFEVSSPKASARSQVQSQDIEYDEVDVLADENEHSYENDSVSDEIQEESRSSEAEKSFVDSNFSSNGVDEVPTERQPSDEAMTQQLKINKDVEVGDTLQHREIYVTPTSHFVAHNSGQISLQNLQLNNHSTSIAEAYQRDLQLRKQSEDSILQFRLHALSLKFQSDMAAIDDSINHLVRSGHAAMSREYNELTLRKQALEMGFLSEKANIESMKASSMARYYQDLLAFQCISMGPPQSATTVLPTNLVGFTQPFETSLPRATPGFSMPVQPIVIGTEQVAASDGTNEAVDEYGESFVVSSKASIVYDAESNGESDENASNKSIVDDAAEINQFHDQMSNSASIPSDNYSEQSNIKSEGGNEEEIESAHEADAVSENSAELEEDSTYEEDFSSVNESTTKQVPDEDEVESEHDDASDTAPKSINDDDDGYEDDFASVSENGAITAQASIVLESAEVVDEEEKDQSIESSQSMDDAISDSFEAVSEDEVNFTEDVRDNTNEEVDEEDQYSNGEFESDHALIEFQPVAIGSESVSAVMAQSTSEDSSTTKLLIKEVNLLQTETAITDNERIQHEESKLASKKMKALELIQAKERLLAQQTEKIRLEEERRQVDKIARLALQTDFKEELRRAKEAITQQLTHEINQLHETFPILKNTEGRMMEGLRVEPTRSEDIVFKHNQDNTSVYTNKTDRETRMATEKLAHVIKDVDDQLNLQDEYDVDSFEHEQSENGDGDFALPDASVDSDNDEVKSEGVSDTGEHELDDDIVDSKVEDTREDAVTDDSVEEVKDDTLNEADADAIASEIGSVREDQDNISIANSEQEENEDFGSDGHEERSIGYENEYEDEVFDDIQSTSSSHVERKEGMIASEITDTAANDSGDEYEYSEEGFENVSDVADAVTHSSMLDLPKRDVDEVHEFSQMDAKRETVRENEDQTTDSNDKLLTAELEAVNLQLLTRHGDIEHVRRTVETDHVTIAGLLDVNESITDPAHFPTKNEEILSKSIEEQIERLEQLKQQILKRKAEIIDVQRHMRIEQRKEVLAAEEKQLLDEMEKVQEQLRIDQAALELSRQRNRLETAHLEARQYWLETGKPPRNVNLLSEFDYVEDVELVSTFVENTQNYDLAQQNYESADRRRQHDELTVTHPQDKEDLLWDYIYVEDAEPVIMEHSRTTVEFTLEKDQKVNISEPLEEENNIGDYIAMDDNEITDACETKTDIFTHHTKDRAMSPPRDVPLDLLSGYCYVEDVEQLDEVEQDLLANFDFVEDVEAVPTRNKPIEDSINAITVAATDHVTREIAPAIIVEDDEPDIIKCTPMDLVLTEDSNLQIISTTDSVMISGDNAYEEADMTNVNTIDDLTTHIASTEDDEREMHAHGEELPSYHLRYSRNQEVKVAQLTDWIFTELMNTIVDDMTGDAVARQMKTLSQQKRLSSYSFEENSQNDRPTDAIIEECLGGRHTFQYDEKDVRDHMETKHDITDASVNKAEDIPAVTERFVEDTMTITKTRDVSYEAMETCDVVTDLLFKSIYDGILASSIYTQRRMQPRQQEAHHQVEPPTINIPEASATSLQHSVEHGNMNLAQAQEVVFQLTEQLQISAVGVQLPTLNSLGPRVSECDQVIYDTIKEIVHDWSLSADNGDYSQHNIKTADAVKQYVRTTMNSLLRIRSNAQDKLKRQIQQLQEDYGDDKGNDESSTTASLKNLKCQLRTNVDAIVSNVQLRMVSRDPTALVQRGDASSITPRSRVQQKSILAAITLQEQDVLQDRITEHIMEDLLHQTLGSFNIHGV